MFPKTGRKLPNRSAILSHAEYMAGINGALQAELGSGSGATKRLMAWTGASDRTVRCWLQGLGCPSGTHLICLARQSDTVFETILELTERTDLMLGFDLHAVEVALAKASGAFEVLRRQHSAAHDRTRKS